MKHTLAPYCVLLGLAGICTPAYTASLTDSTTPEITKKSVNVTTNQLDWEFQIGLGYDSNIYRAPSQDYFDYSKPAGQQDISPVTNDGLYVPLNAEVSHESSASKKNTLITAYNLKSIQYLDSDFSNANYTNHELSFGNNYVLRKKRSRENSLYFGVIYRDVYDLYIDRDTGEDQTGSDNLSAADKYKYNAIGFEAEYEQNIGLTDYDVRFKYLDKDYDSVPSVNVSEYDHTYASISGSAKFTLSKTDKLKIQYKHFIKDYSERKPRDATTGLLTAGFTLEYIYDEFLLSYVKSPNKDLRLYFDYLYRTREDQHQGYADYSKNELKFRALYDLSKSWKSRTAFKIWERDYPNGFAFDRPASGEDKFYDGMKLNLDFSYKASNDKSYLIGLEWTDENSTDTRYEYDRIRAAVGVKWTSQ